MGRYVCYRKCTYVPMSYVISELEKIAKTKMNGDQGEMYCLKKAKLIKRLPSHSLIFFLKSGENYRKHRNINEKYASIRCIPNWKIIYSKQTLQTCIPRSVESLIGFLFKLRGAAFLRLRDETKPFAGS